MPWGVRYHYVKNPGFTKHMLQELYLVRHAAPDRTTGVPYHTPPGPPLTAIGVREAHAAGAWLVGRGIEQLFCSPFTRTRQTAEAIAPALALPITFAETLREGAPGEKMDQIRARTSELLTQIDDSPLRCVALVSHGAPIRSLLEYTTDMRIDLRPHTYDNGNCAPTAGVWYGRRTSNGWAWELAFRPTQKANSTS